MTITKWIATVLAPLLTIFTEHESPGPLEYSDLLEGDQSWVASIALSLGACLPGPLSESVLLW